MSFINNCIKNTMVSKNHLLYLDKILYYVNRNNIIGAIVECGVWKGGCFMYMAYCQKKYSNRLRPIYMYDTYEGMTIPNSDKDAPEALKIYNKINKNTYKRNYDKWHNENKWAYAPLNFVKNNMSLVNYDNNKIFYIKGDVCETLKNVDNLPEKIAILRLDTDWYESTKIELEILFTLVSINGFIIIDDYYAWKGSQNATDEFLINNKDKVKIINKNLTGNIFVMKKISN
jgi:O-methyltransferase